MPTKKSPRTVVKAKTSILSSTAVQVALITGGAAILAAAAAFVSVGASKTLLTVSHLAPKKNPLVAYARAVDVPAFGLSFKASTDVELRRLTLGALADDDGSFSPIPSNDLLLEKIVDTCILRDLGTKSVVSGPVSPTSGTVVFPLQLAVKKGGKVSVQAECTVSASAPASGTADLFALTLVKKAQVDAVTSTGTVLSASAISFGLSASGINPRGLHASVLVKPAVVAPTLPAPTQKTYCPDMDADGYPLDGTSCQQAVSAPNSFIEPRADGKIDCVDTDGNINPGKPEIVGNGKNDDCESATLDQAPPAVTPIVTTTLASGSPTGAGIPGLAELIRFNVIVDQAADVKLHGFTFRLFSTDFAESGWNLCERLGVSSKWGMRDASEMSTRLEDAADWSFYQADGSPCAPGKELVFASVDFTASGDRDPKFVSAGAAVSYILRVDTFGASSVHDDLVRVEMPPVSTFQPLSSALRSIRWSPGFPLSAPVSDVVRNLPVIGGTVVY